MDSQERRAAMVIMAHPDDAEFGSAGTVATWVRDGWEVYYVVCTDASAGGPGDATDVSPAARRHVSNTRKAEQREAAAVLGVKEVIFLDYPDGQTQPTLELRRDLVRMLRRYQPTRVIIPAPERRWEPALSIPRYHPDHLAVGQAALAAIYPASQNPWDFSELLDEGLQPHRVREIFIAAAPILNYYVDISDVIDIKFQALRRHASQVGNRFDEVEKMLRGFGADLGKQINVPYAEAYHRVEN
jgi:LmbE family N-acetylglucosaminyl deacetylase